MEMCSQFTLVKFCKRSKTFTIDVYGKKAKHHREYNKNITLEYDDSIYSF